MSDMHQHTKSDTDKSKLRMSFLGGHHGMNPMTSFTCIAACTAAVRIDLSYLDASHAAALSVRYMDC